MFFLIRLRHRLRVVASQQTASCFYGAATLKPDTNLWLGSGACILTVLVLTIVYFVPSKTAIPWGFFLLIPAIAATGGSGFSFSKGQRKGLIGAKLKRMPFIAATGLLILIPSALFLASKARAGEFNRRAC